MADNNSWDNWNDELGSDWNLDLDFDGADSTPAEEPAPVPARPAKKIAKTAGDDFDKLDLPIRSTGTAGSAGTAGRAAAGRPEKETGEDRRQKAQPAVSQIRARHAEGAASSGKKSLKKPAQKKRRGSSVLLLIAVILAVILVVFLAVKLIKGGSGKPGGESTAPAETASSAAEEKKEAVWLQNSNQDILSLANRYYAALTQVDITTLEQILDPGVTIERAKVESEAAVIEGYQDICCYITDGMKTGEWAVYVSFSVKFKNISTPAPGLVPCYVVTDADGNLRLIPWTTIEKGGEIFDYMNEVVDCDSIDQLAASVVAAFKEAKESDETLRTFLNAVSGETEPEEEPTATGEDQTTAAEATDSGEPSEDGFTAADETMYTTTTVKCRYKPNTNDDTEFKVVEAGTAVQVTGIGSGDWNKVCLPDGTKGYMMKKFLSGDRP